MPKVRMTHAGIVDDQVRQVGDVIDVSGNLAELLVADEQAELVTSKTNEPKRGAARGRGEKRGGGTPPGKSETRSA